MHDSISLRQLAEPQSAASVDAIEFTEKETVSFDAKLARLEASTQKLQVQNLELRLRLQRRKIRWAFERQLLVIGGMGLLLLGLVVGLFLGLVVVSHIR